MNDYKTNLKFKNGELEATRSHSRIYVPIIGYIILAVSFVAVIGVWVTYFLDANTTPTFIVVLQSLACIYMLTLPSLRAIKCSQVNLSPERIRFTNLKKFEFTYPLSAVTKVKRVGLLQKVTVLSGDGRTIVHYAYSKPGYTFLDTVSQIQRYIEHQLKTDLA